MCAFQKNALAYIDKKCMMFDRKGNQAIFLDIFATLLVDGRDKVTQPHFYDTGAGFKVQLAVSPAEQGAQTF